MPLGELYDPSRGYLMNDTLIIEAEVLVRRIVDYWTYDSKKETGYVGLKNQGATCYMNSLLQTLYHIPYFRKVRLYLFFYLAHLFDWIVTRMLGPGYCISGCIPYAYDRE
jgi:ubiquitin C-terminal hydrolase